MTLDKVTSPYSPYKGQSLSKQKNVKKHVMLDKDEKCKTLCARNCFFCRGFNFTECSYYELLPFESFIHFISPNQSLKKETHRT